MARTSKKAIIQYGIIFPNTERLERSPLNTLADADKEYPTITDPKGNPARLVEVYGRYHLTGLIERVHPMDVPDAVVAGGKAAIEFKTGHGSIIEPCFNSAESLLQWLSDRKNPMFHATHIAYLPYRATSGDDCEDCLVFSVRKFIQIMGERFHLLEATERDGAWGIKMCPWIVDGYANAEAVGKKRRAREAEIREVLVNEGETLREFADRLGIEWHD